MPYLKKEGSKLTTIVPLGHCMSIVGMENEDPLKYFSRSQFVSNRIHKPLYGRNCVSASIYLKMFLTIFDLTKLLSRIFLDELLFNNKITLFITAE